MHCYNFLKVHKNTGEKYLSAYQCFVKTNTINCDDNDDAICFLILGILHLLGSSWNEFSLEILERSICVAVQPFYVH